MKEKPPVLDLISLPLISQYRVLVFFGRADGSDLTPSFSIDTLTENYFVLKSLKLIPYADADIIDFYVSDGTTDNEETIVARQRLTRVVDDFLVGAQIDFKINGTPVGLFDTLPDAGYPMDLELDNIFYLYPEKLETLTLNITGIVYSLNVNTTSNPFIKVVVECYSL